MEIDPKKLYHVRLTSVKLTFRKRYGKRCFTLLFDIPEIKEEAKRTIDIPKTTLPTSSTFTRVMGPILPRQYPDSLLITPEVFAVELDKDLAGQTYGAYLSRSQNGKFVDIESLQLI